MEGGTSGGYNHQRGKAVTDNDYNDKNTTAATTIMRSCSSCNLGVLCRMLTKRPSNAETKYGARISLPHILFVMCGVLLLDQAENLYTAKAVGYIQDVACYGNIVG